MSGARVCLYFCWSRPREIEADLGVLENRYPTLFEFRRAIWPLYEWASDAQRYGQDISGFLDHVVLYDFEVFNSVVTQESGHPVAVIQREGDRPPVKELDDALLKSVDVLIVVSLDHFRTNQRPTSGEIECISSFLRREGTRLFICPHHDVGVSDDLSSREIQFRHHGDPLVPSQQRIGGFGRHLLEALGLPIENRFGLSPGRAPDGSPATLHRLSGDRGILEGVETFNLHPHLPHFWVPPGLRTEVAVLARQPVNLAAAVHPFVEAGNDHFNAFLHVAPGNGRAGDIYVCDATLWSSAFGGDASLKRLWRNLTQKP